MSDTKATHPNASIFVVDDNPENVKLVARFLEYAGYFNVETFVDSAEALRATLTREPELLLLDLQMPEPDGYEILATLRSRDGEQQGMPILVFTADANPLTREKVTEAGSTDFLTKPGDAVEILTKVKKYIGEWRARDSRLA